MYNGNCINTNCTGSLTHVMAFGLTGYAYIINLNRTP